MVISSESDDLKMMHITSDFWHGKRVLLTGHTGFKGGWLALWLSRLGAQVTGYALPPTTVKNLYTLANVDRHVESHFADIRDAALLQQVMTETSPDIVFHLAAQPLVRLSYAEPIETLQTNVMGTAYLLDAVRHTPSVRAVVNVTTDKCYENQEWFWGYRENEALGGYDPYSSSKACSELVTAAWRSSFFNAEQYQEHGVAIATARAGNVIGGGDWSDDRLVPDLISAFSSDCAAIIRNPYAIRPWQHVLEPLAGYLMLAERLYTKGMSYAEAWNFGPRDTDARPVSWIAEHLAQLWEGGARWENRAVSGAPHEAKWLKLDISKAQSRLGWRPKLHLENALELTVDWAKAYLNGENMEQTTLNHIETYESLIHEEK